MLFDRYREIIPEFSDFQDAIVTPQPNQLRINTLRADTGTFLNHMKQRYDVALHPGPLGPESCTMDGLPNPGATIEYFLGKYHMQGFSSMLPPLALAPRRGDHVLDLCAAPGSKTTQIAALMGNTGLVVANDARKDRLNLLKFQLERLGVLCAMVTSYPAQAFPLHDRPAPSRGERESGGGRERQTLGFDGILADVPCTGEGSCRPSPGSRRARTEVDLSRYEDARAILRYAKLQRQIIRRAWELLRPGGVLVYSTCTFAPEENEEIVDGLLAETNAVIEPVGVEGPWDPGLEEWQGKRYAQGLRRAIRVYPHHFDSWGFFVARIRKPEVA